MLPRTKMPLKTIATYAAIIVATLVGAEFLARVWDWSPPTGEPQAGDRHGRWRYGFSHGGAGDLVPNQDGHWVVWFHRPYHVQTNSVGLRHTEEPSEKAFRILALGDSQTFGPYLANEDTWPAWTESYLRQRYGDAGKVQVFNAGISGYSIIDELAYLRDKGVNFHPKLVVLAVFENDLDDLRNEKNNALRRSTRKPPSRIETLLKEIGRKSALVSTYDQIRNRVKLALAGADIRRGEANPTALPNTGELVQSTAPTNDMTALANRYQELFRGFVALLKGRNIALAVIFIPSADKIKTGAVSELQRVLAPIAQRTGTPYLDLTETIRREQEPTTRLYLLQYDAKGALVGNGHLSREGNAVIGRTVAAWLNEMKLVPQ